MEKFDIDIPWYSDNECDNHAIISFWTNLSKERDNFLSRNNKKNKQMEWNK